jgi:hypothetical protein
LTKGGKTVRRVKMLTPIQGTVEGRYDGVSYGDVIDIDNDARAEIWIGQKMCVAVDPNTPITGRHLKNAGGIGNRYAN